MAFLIFRPVMRLFKCQGSSGVFWPLDNGEAGNNTTTNSHTEPSEDTSNVILDLGSQKRVM